MSEGEGERRGGSTASPSPEFSYDYSEVVSTPASSKLSPSLLSFHHSFGYDLLRRCNLYVLDHNTVMFISGNLVHFLSLDSGELSYLRSSSGRGIGALAVHPSRECIAVAEKGQQPAINVFSYPGLSLERTLRGGTELAYAHLIFSPGVGLKLACVGASPDFMLTVWDWKQEAIVLRSKAFSQDIFRVTFSPENDGLLTTSGIGHIKFWKMATTFTGLKLQGDIGKFGKREISDVSGYAEFPDGKVLSGSEWGNLLLWEGDLVKVELCRKGQKPCHNGNIEFVCVDEGEIITGGADGMIRIWDLEEIDQADVIDDNDVIEIVPLQEVKLSTRTGASVKHLAKLRHPEVPSYWVVQDNKGSIWRVDLQVSHTHKPPERLFTFHAGAISGLSVCPNSVHAVTCGEDGRVRLYEIERKRFLGRTTFNMPATCVMWLPKWFDGSGLAVVAGFSDGIIRLLHISNEDGQSPGCIEQVEEDCSFVLKQVLKPHSKPVTAILLGDGRDNLNLVTGADDSIFFMKKGEETAGGESFVPLGFMSVNSPVVTLAWAPKSEAERFQVLASFQNATLFLITVPAKGEFDTTKSYQLENVHYRVFRFRSVKYEMLKAAKDSELDAERAKKVRNNEEENSLPSQPSEDEEQDVDPYADLPAPPDTPSPILQAFFHGKSKNFWLCMSGYDSEYLYECWFSSEGPDPDGDKPIKVLPVPEIFQSIQQISALSYSHDKAYLLIGTSNGEVHVHKVNVNGNLSLEQYWALPMGDPESRVTRVCTTYDDQFVLVTTEDGNFFTFKIGIESTPKQVPTEKQASGSELDLVPAKDIEDPKHYSIEEARQRAENDRKLKLAEEQKKQVSAQVNKLRKKFKHFQTENTALPSHMKIEDNDFIMDHQTVRDFEQVTVDNIKTVGLQRQWLSEKFNIGYDKLYSRYKAQLQYDSVVVYSFSADGVMTRTVRCMKRTTRDDELLSEVSAETSESLRYSSRMLPSSNARGYDEKEAPLSTRRVSTRQETDVNKLSKGELRRLQRKQRANEWSLLLTEKPKDSYQHPDDVAMLRDAETNMGNFKLKTSADYSVPEELRMNASKKRIQLVLLRQDIYFRSEVFNEKVIELRDEKVRLIDSFAEKIERLKEIQLYLPKEDQVSLPKLPVLRQEEIPEKSTEFSEGDLLQFELDYEKKVQARAKAKQGGEEFGGFGGFGAAPPPTDRTSDSASDTRQSSEKGSLTELVGDLDEIGVKLPRNAAEQALYEEMLMRTKFERDSILKEISESIAEFDAKVKFLSNYKAVLDTQIKLSDLKHILLFEEYLLLKDFEKREQNFISKLKGKQKDRLEIQNKLNSLKGQIDTKQSIIQECHDSLKELEDNFQHEIANNKFADFLLRVFKKKIKRVKQAEKKTDGDSSNEESDSDLESEYSSEEGSEVDKEVAIDDSVCPAGCQESLFLKSCELRESRMDLEDKLGEEKRALDQFKKDAENSSKKAKVMDSAVKSARSDLENFQLEKQHRLNELDVLVLLRISQILIARASGDPPPHLTTALVFSETNLTQLNLRAGEIREEQMDLRRQRKDLEAKKQRLANEKKTMVVKVQELESQVDEIMMLKFGRKVDLEFFDPIESSKNVIELQEQLKLFEKQSIRELNASARDIVEKKKELDEILQMNTRRLQSLTQLLGRMSDYEEKLEAGERRLGSEFQSSESRLTSDNAELSNLVKMQAVQIEGLSHEIRVLSLKTGHVPPPRVPPIAPPHFMKQPPTNT